MSSEINQIYLSEKLEKFTNEFLLHKDERGKILEKYQTEIFSINPLEAVKVFNVLALRDDSLEIIKSNIDKLTSVFFKPLQDIPSKKYSGFYTSLHDGNFLLLKTIEHSRPLIKMFINSNNNEFLPEIIILLNIFKKHNIHFKTKIETLFRLLEKALPQYVNYFRIEKLLHNDYNQLLIKIEHLLKDNLHDFTLLNKLIGKLYFRIHLSIYREELVIYKLGKEFIHEKLLYERFPIPEI